MKALVTGGAGFIGSHIAEAICRRGGSVCILDDFSSGSRRNLDWNRAGDKLEVVEGSITNEGLIRKAIEGCEFVFHEAAIPSVPESIEDPIGTQEINVDSTLRLLLQAREAKVKRFVFASSCAIYGDSQEVSKRESSAPLPASPYALQKYSAESYCLLASKLYGVPTVALRYFNVFGPRQSFDSPYSGVIARFCTTVLAGREPVIYGTGEQSRDFVYVSDVVAANLAAAESDAESVAGEVFNIGTGESVSILRLARTLFEISGRKGVEPKFEAGRPGDILHSRADISKARERLGYKAQVSFEKGLNATLEFYRSEKWT